MRKFWTVILIIALVVIVGGAVYFFWDDITAYVNSILDEKEREDNFLCDTFEIHYIELPRIGDATLLKCGDFDMLIDGGDNVTDSINALKSYLSNHITDGKIEVLMATHADSDHIGGLFGLKSATGILFNYDIDYIIDYGFEHNTNLARDYALKRDDLVSNGTKYCAGYDFVNEVEGCDWEYVINKDLVFNIIDTGDYTSKHTNPNNGSLVFEVLHFNHKYLFTGDLLERGEKKLVTKGLSTYDVFQAGHHGSHTSNSKEFLEMINVKEIIISVTMDNSHDIPKQEAVDKIYATTQTVYATGTNGTIVLESTSSNYEFKFAKNDLLFHQSEWFINKGLIYPGNYLI